MYTLRARVPVALGHGENLQQVYEVTAIVPTSEPRDLASLETMLCDEFGGFTRTPGKGGWSYRGENIIEEVYVYTVLDTADIEHVTAWINILRGYIRMRFDQTTAYCTAREVLGGVV